MKRTVLLFIGFLLATSSTYAQDIFKKHGHNKEMLTLSKGRYKETFINEDMVQIGTVLINTCTDKVITFLEEDTTGLVYKAESTSSFLTMDPLAEKYPHISPYVYCANNPILYTDPDGRDIKIYYQDENDKWQTWTFTGSNQDQAPNNQFVTDFMTAYNYNVENGGGDKLKEAAASTEFTINVVGTSGESSREDMDTGKPQLESFVRWNPTDGLETKEGNSISPATVLEHEVDHAISVETNYSAHMKRVNTYSQQYRNKEEERVITGSEAKTARANGEFSKTYMRQSYRTGKSIITSSPTSNKKLRYRYP